MKKGIFFILVIGLVIVWTSEDLQFRNNAFEKLLEGIKHINLKHKTEEESLQLTNPAKEEHIDKMKEQEKYSKEAEENNLNQVEGNLDSIKENPFIVEENINDISIDISTILQIMKDNLNLISLKDKTTIANIVLSHFSFNEINDWKNKAYDGITEQEKDDFKNTVYERLNSEDIEKLKDLTEKYLSQISLQDVQKLKAMVDAYIE